MAANRFLVVVHDVAPVFSEQLTIIVEELMPLLGNRFSAAVVPSWHGGPSGAGDNDYLELLGRFGERLVHGWTHQREHRRGLISLLTGQADEFRALDATSIRRRIRCAQTAFAALTGQPAQGFVPPAWQLPICSAQLDGLGFVMRFHRLESCVAPHAVQPLATWSWDWGRLGSLAVCAEALGRFLKWKDPATVPCIAIHPADVTRGWFLHSLQVIRRLLERNHAPRTGAELLTGAETVP